MDIETCKTCKNFTTIHVTGDTRKYPACEKNKRQMTWDVKEEKCKYEEYEGVVRPYL